MKSLYISCFLLCCAVLPAQATGIGLIESWEVGEVRQEVGLFQSSSDWEPQEADFNAGAAIQNSIYGQGEYGINEGLAAYFRLGVADLVLEKAVLPILLTDVTSDMEGELRPWGGIGVKGVIGGGRPLSLGYFVDGRYFANYSDEKTTVVGGTPVRLEMTLKEYWSAEAGLPLQLKFYGCGLFVGPVVTISSAKLEVSATALGVTDTTDSVFREKSPIGVMAGLAIPLGTMGRVSIEGRFGNTSAWGAVINFAQFDF